MPRPERTARWIGVAAALVVAAVSWRLIGWPAPGVAVGIGFSVYFLTRALLSDRPPPG